MSVFLSAALAKLNAEKRKEEEKRQAIRKACFSIAGFQPLYEAAVDKVIKKQDIAPIIEEIDLFLAPHGYTYKLLTMPDLCPVCGGNFFLTSGENCECLNYALGAVAESMSLKPKIDCYRFSKLEKGLGDKEESSYLRMLYAALHNYQKDGDRRNIVISGYAGTGKSYAISVLFNILRKNSKFVYMLSARTLADLFYEFIRIDSDKSEILSVVYEPDYLIIDDLGAEFFFNDLTLPLMLELLEERANKSTIIATNLRKEDFKTKYGDRITSRLFEKDTCIYFLLEGKDLRTQKKQKL